MHMQWNCNKKDRNKKSRLKNLDFFNKLWYNIYSKGEKNK